METLNEKKKRVSEIIAILTRDFPDAKTALNFTTPLELLIATILAAQCTDEQVNKVTPALFKKYPNARDYADAPFEELVNYIHSTGFFNNKAKSIKNCCTVLVERYGGAVPDTLDELVILPGVGRKTANVILGNAFGIPGIVVDTHVKRLSGRLGLSDQTDPDKIEFDLNALVSNEEWTHFSHLLTHHGRKTCQARKSNCKECPINHLCPSNGNV